MDVKSFVEVLLGALSKTHLIHQVDMQTEGPVVRGRAYLYGDGQSFLRFFYNQTTGTLAFALVVGEQRVWGIDRDNRRGWHLHPLHNSSAHIAIGPADIPTIVQMFQKAVEMISQNETGKDH